MSGESLNVDRLASELETRWLGKHLIHRTHVDSTMALARSIATSAETGTVVIAEAQTDGRGRHGRRFVSPHGGLYVTAICEPFLAAPEAWKIGFATSAGWIEAMNSSFGVSLRFDWPNDFYWSHRKVGGVLLELLTPPNEKPRILIGVGLNLGPDPSQIDPDAAGPAGSLELPVAGEDPRLTVLREALLQMEIFFDALGQDEGWAGVLNYLRRSMLSASLGVRRWRHADGSTIEGSPIDLREDGALLVRDASGNVAVVRDGIWIREGGH